MIKEISLKIFSYLPFYDRIQLAMTSKHFSRVFHMIDHNIKRCVLPHYYRTKCSKIYYRVFCQSLLLYGTGACPKLLEHIVKNNDIVHLRLPNTKKLKKTYMKLFRNIQIMNLSNTNLSNDFDLALLRGARVLNISKTDVYDVSMLKHLKYLNISYTEVNDISMLGGLKTLIASHTPIKEVYFDSEVKLKKLDISFTDVSDVSHLSDIEELIIMETNVSSKIS